MLLLLATALAACAGPPRPGEASDTLTVRATAAPEFDAVADSAWISVTGPTIVGFYPIRSNEELERDGDLATVLDDFSYHLGTAIDSLAAAGVTVQMQGGDTIWLRSSGRRWRFTRHPDSADVGYLLVDPQGFQTAVYGVHSYLDLYQLIPAFPRGTTR